jgi:hypothetical protein
MCRRTNRARAGFKDDLLRATKGFILELRTPARVPEFVVIRLRGERDMPNFGSVDLELSAPLRMPRAYATAREIASQGSPRMTSSSSTSTSMTARNAWLSCRRTYGPARA